MTRPWKSRRVPWSDRAYRSMLRAIDWAARELPSGGLGYLVWGRGALRFEVVMPRGRRFSVEATATSGRP